MLLVRLPLVCLLLVRLPLVRLLLVRLLLVHLLRPVACAFDVRRGFISSPRILRQRGSWPLGIIVILLRSGSAPTVPLGTTLAMRLVCPSPAWAQLMLLVGPGKVSGYCGRFSRPEGSFGGLGRCGYSLLFSCVCADSLAD